MNYLCTRVVYREHKSALTRARWCPCLGTIVPFLRRLIIFMKQENLFGILFSNFLMIEIDCSSIFRKIDVVDFRKIFIE